MSDGKVKIFHKSASETDNICLSIRLNEGFEYAISEQQVIYAGRELLIPRTRRPEIF
jgi:hypothetical protein